MATYFDRLLAGLPGFFDKTAQPAEALRVYHPAEVRWTMAAGVLSVWRGDEESPNQVDTAGMTVEQAAERLRRFGFAVAADPDLASRSATVLLDGSGGPAETVAISAYTSVLWTLLRSLGADLDAAAAAVVAMEAQMILPQAYRGWADYWGTYFGMARTAGEADDAYARRIIDEVWRKRNNDVAMEANVLRYAGKTVDLYETWRRMWVLDRSKLSGRDHLPGTYYAYHILHPTTTETVDWDDVLPVIEADRPAGTILVTPTTYRTPQIVVVGMPTEQTSGGTFHSHLRQKKFHVLSDYYLSVNAILGGDRIAHVPAIARGTLRGGWIVPVGPDEAPRRVREATRTTRLKVFDTASGGWDNLSWNAIATSWNAWSAGVAIDSPSMRRTPMDEARPDPREIACTVGDLVATGNCAVVTPAGASASGTVGAATGSTAVAVVPAATLASGTAAAATAAATCDGAAATVAASAGIGSLRAVTNREWTTPPGIAATGEAGAVTVATTSTGVAVIPAGVAATAAAADPATGQGTTVLLPAIVRLGKIGAFS